MPTDNLANFCSPEPGLRCLRPAGGDNLLVIDRFGKAHQSLLYGRIC